MRKEERGDRRDAYPYPQAPHRQAANDPAYRFPPYGTWWNWGRQELPLDYQLSTPSRPDPRLGDRRPDMRSFRAARRQPRRRR